MFINISTRKRKIYSFRRFGDTGDNFKSLYRFEYENVQWISNHFLPDDTETRGGAIPKVEKMKTFLRYIGDPGFQVGVGEDIGIHRTTVSKIIWQVCCAICTKVDDWIKFPSTPDDMREAKREWQTKYKFPGAIGALDCTHVEILKPNVHGDEYLNRKGYFSINVQATANAKECFTSVDVQWPGSVHDSRIWRNSNICGVLNDNPSGAILLADEGYGLTPWLMTPFKNPTTEAEQKYNKLHTRERVLIERMFGQIKSRFPLLSSRIRVATERVPKMIIACFILHNVAKYINDEDFPIAEDDHELPEATPVPDQTREIHTLYKRGKARRNGISEIIQGY